MELANVYLILIQATIIGIFFFIFYRYWFLRDPARQIPNGENIVSPADGKVLNITNFDQENINIDKGRFGRISTLLSDTRKKGILVSIFMSPLDCHINRAPIDGKIISVKHTKGKFKRANSPKAIYNEKNEILLENKNFGRFKVIQIAGFIARRIVSFVDENNFVDKGQRIGLIKLGSQVSMVLPEHIILKVKKGDRVKAGSTILAEFKK